jgi:pyrroline-5-carboxylate reductase
MSTALIISTTSRFVSRASGTGSFAGSPLRFFSNCEKGLYDKIAFIGAGVMAQACMAPLISTGLQPASKIFVFDVSTNTMQKVQKEYGIQTTQTLGELVEGADIIVCAVKPQNLTPQFFAVTSVNPNATLLSIVAGKPIQIFRDGGFNKVARSMPNTPARIGRGMTVWSCTENISTDERDKIKQILSCMGKTVCNVGLCYILIWIKRMFARGLTPGCSPRFS